MELRGELEGGVRSEPMRCDAMGFAIFPMRCDGFCVAGAGDARRCNGMAMLALTMRCHTMPVDDARRCDASR